MTEVAEHAVIGILIMFPDTLSSLTGKLNAGDFQSTCAANAYRSIQKVALSGDVPDMVLVSKEMERSSSGVETVDYLLSCQEGSLSAANLLEYAKQIRSASNAAKMLSLLDQARTRISIDPDSHPEEIFKLTHEIQGLNKGTAPKVVSSKQAFGSMMGMYEDRIAGKVSSLSFGLDALDEVSGGLRDSEVIVIAARPSVGKTALATNIANNVLRDPSKNVLMVSLEMDPEQVLSNMSAQLSGVDVRSIRGEQGPLDEDQMESVLASKDVLARDSAGFFLLDALNASIAELTAEARNFHNVFGLDLLIIDYLQLIKMESMNTNLELGRISREIKTLARVLKIPVVVLSQLNREIEKREDPTPKLSDLKDCGSIEQDADQIIFITRDMDCDQSEPSEAKFWESKNRNGRLGVAVCMWDGSCNKFYNKKLWEETVS